MNDLNVQQLIADFVEWSGGFGPEECDSDEIVAYLEANEIGDERADVLWDAHNGNH